MSTPESSPKHSLEIRRKEVARLRLYRIPLVLGLVILGVHAYRVPSGATESMAVAQTSEPSRKQTSVQVEKVPNANEPEETSAETQPNATALQSAIPVKANAGPPPQDAANESLDPIAANTENGQKGIADLADKFFPVPDVRWEAVAEQVEPQDAGDHDGDASSPIVLVNSLKSKHRVSFLLNGEIKTLEPGESHVVDEEEECLVQFHRGGEFGDADTTLKTGVYKFSASPEGWQLRKVAKE